MSIKNQTGGGLVGILVAVAVLVLAGFIGYTVIDNMDDDDDNKTSTTERTDKDDDRDDATDATAVDGLPFGLTLTNLAALDQGLYEGWVVRDGTPTTFGTFNMTSDGKVDGSVSLTDFTLADGDQVVITIEPSPDTDPAPSATKILSGTVANGTADLSFPLDVSSFSGQYILGTPTTTATDDENAGVWFTTTGTETLLNIPVLASDSGWIYEGWVVYEDNVLTTGKFGDPSRGDDFNGYSGPGNAPDKPGEDYIQSLPFGLSGPLPLDNGTTKVVVSVEPYQNGVDPTGDGPAQVKPLSHTIGAGIPDHSEYDLNVSTDSVPSGSASVN